MAGDMRKAMAKEAKERELIQNQLEDETKNLLVRWGCN